MINIDELLRRAKEAIEKMTPEELEELYRKQRESYARGEMGWPKPKFKWVNGAKVYDSYEDYVND